MSKNYGYISSEAELEKLCHKLIVNGLPFAWDIETGYLGEPHDKYSIHPETAIIAGLSFTNSTDWARYIPIAHDVGPNIDPKTVARMFWRVLATGRGIAHGSKFELRHMSRFFLQYLSDDPELGPAVVASDGFFPVLSDTLIEAALVAEERSYGLKPLVKWLFGHDMITLVELFPDLPKNKQKTLRFNTLELTPKVVEYACEDSVWALAVYLRYHPKVESRILYKTEMAVMPIVAEMERYGLRYDWAYLAKYARDAAVFQAQLQEAIRAELSEMLGEPCSINLGSAKQLSETLYGRLGMKTTVYTASTKNLPEDQRKMSTGAIALVTLANEHPVVQRILDYKQIKTLLTRYLEKYEKEYSYADDGRTHPDHLQIQVITGRFAVLDPPYNQSPKKYFYELPTGETFKMNFRDAIIAPPDHYIFGFDYSQVELRILAGEAQEPALLKAFNEGIDVHIQTASLMLGIPIDQVTPDNRAVGKTMNFALSYGMQVKSLGERLGIPKAEAQVLFDKYFSALSSVSAWKDKQLSFGKDKGYVLTHFGRRVPIWEFQASERWIYQKGERLCINAPIQGAAADYMKIAMVRASKAIKEAGLADRVHLVMNIHDALEWYVHRSVEPQVLIKLLNPAVSFAIAGWPEIKAEWHLGLKYGSLREISLDANGNLKVEGLSQKEDLDDDVLDEEEDSEEAQTPLPKVDVESLKEFIQPSNKQLVVSMPTMPEFASYQRFVSLIKDRPGGTRVIVRTPEGDLPLDIHTSLTPSDLPEVDSVLVGASVLYEDSE